jgi:hypothetical protein
MKLTHVCTFLTGLVLAASVSAQAPKPAAPAPSAGLVNDYLREKDSALNKWDLGGSVRGRYEVKEGFGIPGVPGSVDFRDDGTDVSNDYWTEKLRYRVGYNDAWWSALVEGRSSFAQSDERWAYFATPTPAGTVNRQGKGPESDTVDLHQAYFTVGNSKEFPITAKIGRQELSYGDERLVGAFAWNNIGRVFDTAKFRWQTDWFGMDLFTGCVVVPEDNEFNVDNDHDWFSGVYVNLTKVPKHLLDVYFFSRNADSDAISIVPSPQAPQPSARDIYTLGLRLKSKPAEFGSWDYSIESAYQFGNFEDRRLAGTPRLDHDAWMAIVTGGYTFKDAWGKPRLGLEYCYGSGDGDPTDGDHGTFENLFPTNHKFYGYMDFLSLQNLHDVRAICTLKPHAKLTLNLEGHSFWLADTSDNFYNAGGAPRGGTATTPGNNYGVNPGYDSFLGFEVDVVASYAITRYAQLEAGYGHFFRGDYIEDSLSAIGSQDADWFYIQAVFNF